MYAFVRCNNILLKANQDNSELHDRAITIDDITEDVERELLLHILDWHNILELVGVNLYPHLLCEYLYDGAKLFHKFFAQCPVIDSDQRQNRLFVCKKTQQFFALGLKLLGCKTTNIM